MGRYLEISEGLVEDYGGPSKRAPATEKYVPELRAGKNDILSDGIIDYRTSEIQ
jgi:hypothetical protein